MATQAQIEANRRNALKSTGPRTDEGKAKSRRNSMLHGLRAKELTFEGDFSDQCEEFLADLREEFPVDGPIEEYYLQNIQTAIWQLRRLANAETHRYRHCRSDHYTRDLNEFSLWESDASPSTKMAWIRERNALRKIVREDVKELTALIEKRLKDSAQRQEKNVDERTQSEEENWPEFEEFQVQHEQPLPEIDEPNRTQSNPMEIADLIGLIAERKRQQETVAAQWIQHDGEERSEDQRWLSSSGGPGRFDPTPQYPNTHHRPDSTS